MGFDWNMFSTEEEIPIKCYGRYSIRYQTIMHCEAIILFNHKLSLLSYPIVNKKKN